MNYYILILISQFSKLLYYIQVIYFIIKNINKLGSELIEYNNESYVVTTYFDKMRLYKFQYKLDKTFPIIKACNLNQEGEIEDISKDMKMLSGPYNNFHYILDSELTPKDFGWNQIHIYTLNNHYFIKGNERFRLNEETLVDRNILFKNCA